MTADRDRAAADLAALDADRVALAERVVPPPWFGPALGLLLFAFISSNALDSPWVTAPAVLLFGLGTGLLVAVYRRSTGVWVHTPPRVLAGWAVLVVAVLVPAYLLGDERPWVFVVAGAVLGVAVAVLSARWTRAWQRELREGV
ncbi:hypothetical protein [Modestobacter sp. Leaf380]|uniref:hypothetical protein n=1 Tax=Modestobacter sp. Leaf380 TaxID=1736356 RepID=UPI0006F39A1E|nr:hypothetical protein [Modestobacter sp. Leaf380]KQS68682.1 hypothetical protein ASG41_07070 [Modestobacter sp. Leaf380]